MVISVKDGSPPSDLDPIEAPATPPAADPPREGVLRSLRLRVRREGIEEGELGSPGRAATAPPVPHTEPEPLAVVRSFGFVDISGFTAFCDRHGELQAFELLATFRSTTREVTARRGVRVAKWLGDGVMLVGLDPTALAATVAEITMRCRVAGLDTHAGVATGSVLLFEGDDYIGRPVNLAARLCSHAELGEILLVGRPVDLPDWLTVAEVRTIEVAGVDEEVVVQRVEPQRDIVAQFFAA